MFERKAYLKLTDKNKSVPIEVKSSDEKNHKSINEF